MSFFHTLGRALGFGHDNEDDEDDYTPIHIGESDNTCSDDEDNDGRTPLSGTSAATAPTAAGSSADYDCEPVFKPEIAGAIFEKVVEVFNASLPDFLQKSVDPKAQRTALAEALDDSVKQYMAGLNAEATRRAENRLRSASDASRAESERLRKEMEKLELQKASIQEQQLSADRRRRALQDRNKDLEEQVSRLEAEREQFQLENRSLLNKIKLSDVQPGIIDELNKEIERLRAQNPADEGLADALQEKEARIAQLEENISSTNEALAAARTELEEMKKHQSDVEAGVELSKQMYTQLQEELTGERAAHAATASELEQARQSLSEANVVAESVKQLEEQLSQVEGVIAKRDERIASLKARNKKLKEELAAANEQAMRTKESDKGLFALADAEQLAGDEDFECPDWFVSEPGPTTPPLNPVNTDFGYTEPPRKPRIPDNDAQMSLF